MKKILVVVLSLIFVLSACSSKTDSEKVEEKYTSYSIQNLEYEVPESWTEKVTDESLKYYYPKNAMLMVGYTELDGTISNDKERSNFVNGFISGLEFAEVVSESNVTVNNNTAYQYEINAEMSNEMFETSMVVFDYPGGVMSFYMATLETADVDYSLEFAKILDSIEFEIVEEEPQEETVKSDYYFDGKDLVKKDYKITITDYKVIQPGETGNEYGEQPVLAFWYDTTVAESAISQEYNPTTVWMTSFDAVQDNDPNLINELNVSSHPDSAYLDTQMATIKPGGTVTNAVAYKLTDLETPVTLIASESLLESGNLGSFDYQIQ